jgi:glycine/D-amino acid oxidase-like deaminating enzyme
MTVDFLIIGQGLCGTWLSYYLLKSGRSVLVIDNSNHKTASKVASGLINPVTGRRVVTTWLADELLPFVRKEYEDFSKTVNSTCIAEKNILAFPSAPDLQQAFHKRMNEGNSYIFRSPLSKESLREYFNFPFDVMAIAPCFLIDVQRFIGTWKDHLLNRDALLEDQFEEEKLNLNGDHVQYKNITAEKIIYCNGIETAFGKYWNKLPFVANKGQALIIGAPGIPRDFMYKFGHLTMIPWKDDFWWVGSSNELEFEDELPTEDYKTKTVSILRSILKMELSVIGHVAALRPAAVERRPFVGIHPHFCNVGILNGMGSKGCSLAPWFAKEMTEHLTKGKPINPLADVNRYSNLLKRMNED